MIHKSLKQKTETFEMKQTEKNWIKFPKHNLLLLLNNIKLNDKNQGEFIRNSFRSQAAKSISIIRKIL